MSLRILVLLALIGCTGNGKKAVETDADGDGVATADDCDDADSAVGAAIDAYTDDDGDGYGLGAVATCTGEGTSELAGDCDDTNAAVHPYATEVCDDGTVDDDCDGLIDDDDSYVDPSTRVESWRDADGDGHGEMAGTPAQRCAVSPGWVSVEGQDCDDTNPDISPDAEEICNTVDDDCDSEVDEAGAVGEVTWFKDHDRDSYGDAATTQTACVADTTWVSDDTDCDDSRNDVYPGADEVCNRLDDNCNTNVDEDAIDAIAWYADLDGDTFGDPDDVIYDCARVTDRVRDPSDCDDSSASVNPASDEQCDSADADEDCDGASDDADTSTDSAGMVSWYPDGDADGYGSGGGSLACDAPAGDVDNDDDCDDSDSAVNPAATERCDTADTDEDCDGFIDDDDSSATGTSTGWYDGDGDGYGDASVSATLCELPADYLSNDDDCDDADAAINPGETEACDAADTDEDCDGLTDDDDASTASSGMSSWYLDADSDAFGVVTSSTTACDLPSGYADNTDDCDDADGAINPDAAEVCGDTVDDNCDGVTACDTDVGDDDRTFTGTTSGTYFSWDVSSADQDGDGVDDLIFGTSGSGSSGSDAAYVVTGGGSGDLAMSSATATFTGTSCTSPGPGPGPGPGPSGCGGGGGSGGTSGSSVAGLGDTNGDGYDDFAVGGSGSSGSTGVVYLVRGPQSGTVALTSATATWSGSSSSDDASDVMPAGDVNADGTDDVLIGAAGYSASTGAVYLLTTYTTGTSYTSSIATATLTGESAGDALTASGGRGDLDADGYEDVVVGAAGDDDVATDSGAAYVFLGPVSGTQSASAADIKIEGEGANDAAGECTSIGDIDGDGYDDLVVVADGYSTYGAAYVLNGPLSAGWTLATADARIDSVRATGPSAVSADGDVDPDGYADLLLGYPADNTIGGYSGAGALFHGPIVGTLDADDADWYITGESAGGWVGLSVSFVGSQDASTGDDVILSAPYLSPSGAAYLFYGDQI